VYGNISQFTYWQKRKEKYLRQILKLQIGPSEACTPNLDGSFYPMKRKIVE